jgi:hypothetical protein
MLVVMPRTGLTNFAVWAMASAFVSYIASGELATCGAVIVPVALLVAWQTRYWQEALGALSGFTAICLLNGILRLGVREDGGGGPYLVAGAVLAAAVVAMWRYALAREAELPVRSAPGSPATASTPGRLALASVVGSVVPLFVSAALSLILGLRCQSDTNSASPGSDLAGYCDAMTDRPVLILVLVGGPPLIALVVGLVGARRRNGPVVLAAIFLGCVVAAAAHVPDFVLSTSA